MGDMSEDQEKHLEVFRKYIQENNLTDHPQYDDYYLLRFLRARKFDMDKTILMFTTFLNWRKENDVDNIIDVSAFFLFITRLCLFLLGIMASLPLPYQILTAL